MVIITVFNCLLHSVPYPGPCGFRVQFPEGKYDSSTNNVFLRRNVPLAAMFKFKEQQPPADSFVRALVCVKEPGDLVKIGPTKRCLGHPVEEQGVFLIQYDPSLISIACSQTEIFISEKLWEVR